MQQLLFSFKGYNQIPPNDKRRNKRAKPSCKTPEPPWPGSTPAGSNGCLNHTSQSAPVWTISTSCPLAESLDAAGTTQIGHSGNKMLATAGWDSWVPSRAPLLKKRCSPREREAIGREGAVLSGLYRGRKSITLHIKQPQKHGDCNLQANPAPSELGSKSPLCCLRCPGAEATSQLTSRATAPSGVARSCTSARGAHSALPAWQSLGRARI